MEDGRDAELLQPVVELQVVVGGGDDDRGRLAQLEKPAGLGKEQSGTDLQPHPTTGEGQTVSDMPQIAMPVSYTKFTNQSDLGKYLTAQYHIRTANELASCEVCHR